MKIICLANQKGGCAKTSSAASILAGLVNKKSKGKRKPLRILGVDTDPQGTLTGICGFDNTDGMATLYDVFDAKYPIKDTIVTVQNGFDLVPGDILFAKADKRFSDFSDYFKLKKALKEVEDDYDYCIIDTPPSLGVMLQNALIASDYIIIPMFADYASLKGLSQLKMTIDEAREPEGNPNLKILGILLTRVEKDNITDIMTEEIKESADIMETEVLPIVIKKAAAIKEVQYLRSNLFIDKKKAQITKDYANLVDLIIKRTGEK